MKLALILAKSFAFFTGATVMIASISSCEYLSTPRSWGTCAAVGAVLGGGAGAGIGLAISNQTAQKNNVASGVGGGAVGLVVGAVVGHYLCDPIVVKPTPPRPPSPSPAPPPPPPPPPVKEKIDLRGVHFDFNKYAIRPGDAAVLDEAATTLKSHPNLTVNVNGYCDAIGSEEYNLKLSQRRANAVTNYLGQHGIPASRLMSHGYGKSDFIAPNDTEEGRAQNRRVELVPND